MPTSFKGITAMNREAILSGNSRQYISVKDVELLEQIEKLLPHYTTFNKLLNDALRLGLPLLLREKENKKITLEEEPSGGDKTSVAIPKNYEADNRELKTLLSQIVINTSLNKSMLSGLYNLKESEIANATVKKRFSEGLLNDTPNCLFDAEIDMLKEIGKDEEDE